MRTRIVAAVAALTLAGLLLPPLASPAAAHEHRKIGKYNVVVGFGTEPAFAGAANSVQLILSDAKDKPVTTPVDSLEVAVTTGDAEALELPLEPHFGDGWGTPGDYRAFFIPTAPGPYTFKFTGAIKGQKIDQSFTSGPKSFSEMADPAETQYPTKEPSGSQLSERLDRESARTQAALAADRDTARDAAAAARTLAVIGLLVGAAGLLAAVAVGRAALRRRPVPADQPELHTVNR